MSTTPTRRRKTAEPQPRLGHQGTEPGRMLDISQVAERLGTGERFVRRLIEERRISYTKLGPGKRSPVRISEAVLDEYIARRTVEAQG